MPDLDSLRAMPRHPTQFFIGIVFASMNLSRASFLKGMVAIFTFADTKGAAMEPAVDYPATSQTPALCSEKTCQFHEAPKYVDYSTNQSVFGKILRGEAPALVLKESATLLAFLDRKPRAPLHALVIPKGFIASVFALSKEDLPLLEEMRNMGIDLVKTYYPDAYRDNDYILCFHVPPFNSVDHIHLHVMAPASQIPFYLRRGKYQVGTRWCTSLRSVRRRLKAGKSAIPPIYSQFIPNESKLKDKQ